MISDKPTEYVAKKHYYFHMTSFFAVSSNELHMLMFLVRWKAYLSNSLLVWRWCQNATIHVLQISNCVAWRFFFFIPWVKMIWNKSEQNSGTPSNSQEVKNMGFLLDGQKEPKLQSWHNSYSKVQLCLTGDKEEQIMSYILLMSSSSLSTV